jgi:hypothetical protein
MLMRCSGDADEMRPITIRVSDDLLSQINEERGDKPTASFCRDALSAYILHQSDVKANTSEYASLLKENTYLRSKLDEMAKLLSQAQAVSLSLTKQLPGEVAKAKKWWQFWRGG